MKVVKRIKRLTPYPETREAEFRYRFDYQGRMEKITYPDGEEVTYSYNRGRRGKKCNGNIRIP